MTVSQFICVALVKVLHEYEQKYGMRFFATPGNLILIGLFDIPGI